MNCGEGAFFFTSVLDFNFFGLGALRCMGTLKPTSGSDSDDESPCLLLPFLVDDCAESALEEIWEVFPGVTIERALEGGMLEKDVDLDFDP